MGEPLAFRVESRSHLGTWHTCRWLGDALDGGPTCSCRQWAMENRRHRATHCQNFICAHLEASRDWMWRAIIEDAKEKLLAQ